MSEAISFDCEDLIYDVECDIKEFGKTKVVTVWKKKFYNKTFYVNYDFAAPKEVAPAEMREGETLVEMTLGELLERLQAQNSVVEK